MSKTASRERRRASVPRKIRPGTIRTAQEGGTLTCLVLAKSDTKTGLEWAGVDLSSGALVRNRVGSGEVDSLFAESSPLEVVTVLLLNDDEPRDPARPEGIAITDIEIAARGLRRRKRRKLLRQLSAPIGSNGPLLGAHGPSIAFVDLNGRTPSIVLLETKPKKTQIVVNEHGAALVALELGPITQMLPVADPVLAEAARRAAPLPLSSGALAEVIGGKPAFFVVGLLAVTEGHARKAVISILPR